MLFGGANSLLRLKYENSFFWVLNMRAIGGTIVALVYRFVFRLANYNYKLFECLAERNLRIKSGN